MPTCQSGVDRFNPQLKELWLLLEAITENRELRTSSPGAIHGNDGYCDE